MPRSINPVLPTVPFHVCARTNERLDFGAPLEVVWMHMENYLHFLHFAYGVRVHSFVLMPNHFHLLATFERSNLGEAMNYFMRETSKAIARDSGRMNHLYSNRAFRSAIRTYHYFMHAYKYVYRNPVEANLCERVEQYRFSTLHSKLGFEHGMIPLEEDVLLFDDLERQLVWLNRTPDIDDLLAVKQGLRRREFSLKRDPKSLRAHQLESVLY